eukprot:428059-Prymnesium_polylepis.1
MWKVRPYPTVMGIALHSNITRLVTRSVTQVALCNALQVPLYYVIRRNSFKIERSGRGRKKNSYDGVRIPNGAA